MGINFYLKILVLEGLISMLPVTEKLKLKAFLNREKLGDLFSIRNYASYLCQKRFYTKISKYFKSIKSK